MKEIFPYEGRPVTVTQDMCDFNGHMNVNHIKAVFEQGWEFGSKEFGFDDDYLKKVFHHLHWKIIIGLQRNFF